MPSDIALQIAGRIWCDKDMKSIVMNAKACEYIATIIDEVRSDQEMANRIAAAARQVNQSSDKMAPEKAPIPMILICPSCSNRHIDEGKFAEVPHRTHACQYCGMVWKPALVSTVGVRFLPGHKNDFSD